MGHTALVQCTAPIRCTVGQFHFCKTFVAQNAGVVHQNVHAAPGIHRLLHHGLNGIKVGDGRAIGNRLAAGRNDLVDHGLRRADGAAGAVARTAQVIHHHFRAARGQCQRVLLAQPATGSGDDGDATLEIQTHINFLLG